MAEVTADKTLADTRPSQDSILFGGGEFNKEELVVEGKHGNELERDTN